jgi:mono/diheme cytochrome c family protein
MPKAIARSSWHHRRLPQAQSASARHAAYCLLPIACCLLSGCQQDMARQPKYLPLERSEFFVDGRSARPLEPGVVARGYLRNDWELFAGQRPPSRQRVRIARIVGSAASGGFGPLAVAVADSQYIAAVPLPVTGKMLGRGQERFRIYCALCHDEAGYGNGIIVQRGFTRPPSYHTERLRQAPAGYLYEVISHGYGSMPDYSALVPPRDRWAIVAYVRALQLSQHTAVADLPEQVKTQAFAALEKPSGSEGK